MKSYQQYILLSGTHPLSPAVDIMLYILASIIPQEINDSSSEAKSALYLNKASGSLVMKEGDFLSSYLCFLGQPTQGHHLWLCV